MATKICNKCRVAKPLTAYRRNEKCVGGHVGTCKKCMFANTDFAKFGKCEISRSDFLIVRSIKRDHKSKELGFDGVAFDAETQRRLLKITADGKWLSFVIQS
jgi:hypothetical protein